MSRTKKEHSSGRRFEQGRRDEETMRRLGNAKIAQEAFVAALKMGG
ncbi:hypothetical protein [Methylocella sp.]